MAMQRSRIAQPKAIVIVGPTASGKSELAIKIATWVQQHGGRAEIVSADSRQVYKGLDIGTGKVPGIWKPAHKKSRHTSYARILENTSMQRKGFFYKGVRHHLIDVVSPKRQYTVAEYQKAGRTILSALVAHGSTPIICGGTGLYVDALLHNTSFPKVKPNPGLRKKLERESIEALYKKLQRLDPRRAKTIDRRNKRRLVRALEIAITTGRPVPSFPTQHSNILENVGMLKIGIAVPFATLRKRINARVNKMIRAGLVQEVKKRVKRYGPTCPTFDAIGYRELVPCIANKRGEQSAQISAEKSREFACIAKAIQHIKRNTWHYAKRQMTWFKRDKEIVWIKNLAEGIRLVKKFLSSLRTQ